MTINVLTTTITGGSSITPRIALGSAGLQQIGAPVDWTPATIAFLVSTDGGRTYQSLIYNDNEVVLNISAGQLITVDPYLWQGITDLKIISGTFENQVQQAVDAEIVLIGTFSGIMPQPVLTPVPTLTLTGQLSQVYVGADFPWTQPDTQRVYTFDYINEIAIEQVVTATIGGTVTVGDSVGITFGNVVVPGDQYTIFYQVQNGDSLTSIATQINRLINGTQVLSGAGISSTANGQVIMMNWPLVQGITTEALLIQAPGSFGQPTETLYFAYAGFAGETIGTATCDLISFEGNIDPSPEMHVLAGPTINGSKVSFLVGELLAGTTYRITMTAGTNQQPGVVLYSHIQCQLPT